MGEEPQRRLSALIEHGWWEELRGLPRCEGEAGGRPTLASPLQLDLGFHLSLFRMVVQAEAEFLTDALHAVVVKQDVADDAAEFLLAADLE